MPVITQATLNSAFNLVSGPDWRDPIDKQVSTSDLITAGVSLEDIKVAISCYTGTSASSEAAPFGWRVTAVGYRMGPAGP